MNRPLRTAIVVSLFLPLVACGGGRERPQADLAAARTTTIGVNAYLWRASLDTLSFMPLLQTDSNGGVIVTEWYVNPNTHDERMKVTDIDIETVRERSGPYVYIAVCAESIKKKKNN